MTPDSILRKSLDLGGDGDLHLNYAPSMNRQQPWQAVTTVKPRRHRDRRLWVWGHDPADAMRSLLRAMQDI